MRVSVELKGRGERKEIELPEGSTVWDLLKKLEIRRETVVVFLNGRVEPEESPLKNGALVEILPVVTGG